MPTIPEPTTTAGELMARLSRLQCFLDQDPDNLNLLADVADLALTCGNLPVARTAIQHGCELRPGNPFFSLRMSSVAIAEGNFDEALQITGSLLDAGHRDAAVRFNHAFALVHTGVFADARDMLAELHAEQVPYPLVVPLLIRVHHYLDEIPEGIALAQSYLDSHPGSGEVAGMLSLLFFDNDDLLQAREWSQRALASAPNNLDALLAAGGTALGAEDVEEARTALLHAISVDPRNGRAWSNLALADVLQFDLKAAREKLSQALKYMPEHIGTWHVLGWIELLQGDVDAAENCFRQALVIDENFGETHGGLAAVAAMRGNWEEAEKCAKIARRLNPESMSQHYTQVLYLQQNGQAGAAMEALKSALLQGKAPAGGNLLEMLGRVVHRQRR